MAKELSFNRNRFGLPIEDYDFPPEFRKCRHCGKFYESVDYDLEEGLCEKCWSEKED